MKLARYLRVCAVCGRLPYFATSLLCKECEENLLKCARIQVRNVPPWSCYTLWTWGEEDRHVRELVRKLKGGGDSALYQRLCEWFLMEWFRASLPCNFSDVCFVPAPSREIGHRDHAYELAVAFAAITGATLAPVLRRLSTEQQKFHNLRERAQLRMKTVGTFATDKTLIFVDDVVVTGSTARSAYEALGRPRSFKAWCMVNRPRLC